MCVVLCKAFGEGEGEGWRRERKGRKGSEGGKREQKRRAGEGTSITTPHTHQLNAKDSSYMIAHSMKQLPRAPRF